MLTIANKHFKKADLLLKDLDKKNDWINNNETVL